MFTFNFYIYIQNEEFQKTKLLDLCNLVIISIELMASMVKFYQLCSFKKLYPSKNVYLKYLRTLNI